MRGLSFAVAAVTASLVGAASASADELSPTETDQLAHGGSVTRTQVLERGGRRYVGGVAYAIVDAQTGELAALLDDVRAWRRFLPKTRDVHRVGRVGGDALVEVTHGSPLIHVTYTLRVRREGETVRFWVDLSRPHDIDDAWGFFRTEPLDARRTLVTYGILIDVGGGLLRDLFEDRARRLALTVPERVRSLVLQRRTAPLGERLAAGAATHY